MKLIKKSLFILTVGVLGTTLVGCSKKPLVIPTVDVNSLTINLPERPTYNTGAIKTEGEYDVIDLYELSDFHGAVNCEPDHSSGAYIGLPKLATYFETKRADNPGGTVVLSTGDMFQGSADSNLTRGYMVNYCMQYMGFEAMAVGNHEFDWTDEWLKKNAELTYNTSSIPFLGANILKYGEMPSFLKKSVVLQRADYKIGVIGVIGSELESSILKSAIEGYEFVRYQSIVDTEALRLKTEEGCNAVVLLAHEAADKIQTVSNVDAVFGGHAHHDTESTNNGVPSIATLNYGQSVAHIALKFNRGTKAIVSEATTSNIEAMSGYTSLSDNAGIKNIMNQYAGAIDNIKNIKLGKCNDELAFDGALKHICVNTMYESAVSAVKENNVADIDTSKIVISYHNVKGGIRDNIAKGTITYGDVYRAFPFDNEIVLVPLKGSVLKGNINEEPLSNYGLYRTFSKKSELQDNETYYIVITDYLALTDKFKDALKVGEEDLIRTGKIVRDEVANRVYQIGNVKNSKWAENTENYKAVPRY